jgi:hypothetical protein
MASSLACHTEPLDFTQDKLREESPTQGGDSPVAHFPAFDAEKNAASLIVTNN